MLAGTVLLAGLVAGGVVSRVAPTDKLQVSATALSGTGLSLASAGGSTNSNRSPVFLDVEAGFTHPSIPWLEFTPALLLEAEGRVGFGIEPKLRAFLPVRKLSVFGVVGLPVFVAPYSLLGARAGVGLAVHVHRHFAVTAEASAAVFFWGTDLMSDSILAKLDLAAGVRIPF